MSHNFSRKEMDHYLYLLAKEYKKKNRTRCEAELILVGGSSIVLNYGFREMTTDFDTIFRASSNIKDIIKQMADEYNLPSGWMNDDFKRTESYSPNLAYHSKFYKRFCNCLDVRTINDEYLVAMKLRSARQYKNDLSDIIGVMKENYEKGKDLSLETISKAYADLYGRDTEIPEFGRDLLHEIFNNSDLEELYYSTAEYEIKNKNKLLDIENKYKDSVATKKAIEYLSKRNFSEVSKDLVTETKEQGNDIIHTVDGDFSVQQYQAMVLAGYAPSPLDESLQHNDEFQEIRGADKDGDIGSLGRDER